MIVALIVGVMGAILAPAIGAARESCEKVRCESNLRQLATITRM